MSGIALKELLTKSAEPALSFYWAAKSATFPSFKGIKPEAYWFASCDLPSYAFEAQPFYNGGKRKSYAGSTDSLSFSLSLFITSDYRQLTWVQGWMESIRSYDGFYGLPRDYKKDLVFELQDTTGAVQLEATCKGSWVTNPDSLSMSYNTSDIVMLGVNMTCDDIEYKKP